MKEIIKTYLEWKASYAQRAAVNYRIWLERLVLICGDKELKDFSLSDYLIFKKWVETRYNPYTVQFATIIIKNFLNFCKMQNMECLSPTFIKLPRVFAKSHRALSEPEFESIIKMIPDREFGQLRDLVMIHLLWDTGMRVSELTDLDLTQIEEKQPCTQINTKKTGLKRTIVWSDKTHILLIKYLKLRITEGPHCSVSLYFLVG